MQLLCRTGEQAEMVVWGGSEEGGEEVTGRERERERGALTRRFENEYRVQSKKFFKTSVLPSGLNKTLHNLKKSFSFPLSFFPLNLVAKTAPFISACAET